MHAAFLVKQRTLLIKKIYTQIAVWEATGESCMWKASQICGLFSKLGLGAIPLFLYLLIIHIGQGHFGTLFSVSQKS